MAVAEVFARCVEAISHGLLVRRESSMDKEFHFQNWFRDRLRETGQKFEVGGRNSYPDFRMVNEALGFEVKGLAYPGRVANFDSNSQAPSGCHNDRTIFYVFGRYPKKPDGDTYPVLDLVVCHGSFLNADTEYIHENKSIRFFGTYGDILIRDRKMYVVPTPFTIADGLAHHQTLILPHTESLRQGFVEVGHIRRREADELIVGYFFDLTNNDLHTKVEPNPSAGREHLFRAWRANGSPETRVRERAYVEPVKLEDYETNS